MAFQKNQWIREILTEESVRAMPIISFPAVSLLGVTVKDFIRDPKIQAQAILAVHDRCPEAAASLCPMDLSVEAECFGTPVRFSEGEVPTCSAPLLDPDLDEDEHLEAAEALSVPEIGSGRTEVYLEAVRIASQEIHDRPLFAGCIGPFSLAGRLVDVTNSLMFCLTEPEYMETVLEKTTEFIIRYIRAFKEAGADGIIMAEPLAGLLSPSIAAEFSGNYCRRVSEAVKDEHFAFLYHNCGNTTNVTTESILLSDADLYNFGNVVDMEEMLQKMPEGVIVTGNVDPVRTLRFGTPESVREEVAGILSRCGKYKNFMLSTGCDVPPATNWDNIDAFYEAVNKFNEAYPS